MSAVLISIQPKWVAKITSGEKTIEVRKTKPKLKTPFKVYIYATKSGDKMFVQNGRVYEISKELTGKVIGEFICDEIHHCAWFANPPECLKNEYDKNTCLTTKELFAYSNGGDFYEWYITDLKIYDKPKELSEFEQECKYAKGFPKSCRNKGCECYYEEWQNCYAECVENGYRKLQRPPQSWCYVEE